MAGLGDIFEYTNEGCFIYGKYPAVFQLTIIF